jgi:cytoskeletal protein RodZ
MASFGESLRRERELRGVSLREIAEATKISIRLLQALEDDRLDVLPGGVFRRSFVRQYAEFVGLDADRVVAEFAHAHETQTQPGRAEPVRSERASPGTYFLVGVLCVGAVLAILKAGGQRGNAPLQPEGAPPMAAIPVTRPPRPAPPPAAVEPADEGLTLTLAARQSCWVQVKLNGETVLDRVLEEGQSETVEADGEIVLSVGNAGGLTFTVNDRPGVSLGRSGEVRRNIVISRENLPSLVEGASQVRASQSS